MFDAIGAFTKQFTPVDGGYLYYPSPKAGGKLVTTEEFQALLAGWKHVAGGRGRWISIGLLLLATLLWTTVSTVIAMPKWGDWAFPLGVTAVFSAWVLWASFAPRRLVRGRPAVAPPRPISLARREARTAVNWPFVIVALSLSGTIFFVCLIAPIRTLSWWGWLIGSALIFCAYLWIAYQKLTDRSR